MTKFFSLIILSWLTAAMTSVSVAADAPPDVMVGLCAG